MENSRFKFRAWDKRKRIMVYRNENESADYWDGVYAPEVQLINALLGSPLYEFMQYTGLKDRNGREIYEGDIVKARDVKVNGQDKFYICEVKWMPTGWYAMSYKDLVGTEHYLSLNILETEVIGNIYENPELLEDPK